MPTPTPRSATVYRSKVASPATKVYARARISSESPAPSLAAADLDMVIQFTFDRANLYEAEWYGDQWEEDGVKYRMARLLLGEDNLPTNGKHALYAHLIDNPEEPFINAGTLTVV